MTRKLLLPFGGILILVQVCFLPSIAWAQAMVWVAIK